MEFCWLVKLIVKLKYWKKLLDYLSIKDPYPDFLNGQEMVSRETQF